MQDSVAFTPGQGILGITVATLKQMPPETLFNELEPFIRKWSKSFIPGYEWEDVRQEVLIVIWVCQQRYDPDNHKGHANRVSSFMNFLIHAVKNRLGNCKYYGQRQVYASRLLECTQCGESSPIFSRSKRCHECGGTHWRTLPNVRMASIDALNEYSDSWQPGLDDDVDPDTAATIEALTGLFPEMDRQAAMVGLRDGVLTPSQRSVIKAGISANPGMLRVASLRF